MNTMYRLQSISSFNTIKSMRLSYLSILLTVSCLLMANNALAQHNRNIDGSIKSQNKLPAYMLNQDVNPPKPILLNLCINATGPEDIVIAKLLVEEQAIRHKNQIYSNQGEYFILQSNRGKGKMTIKPNANGTGLILESEKLLYLCSSLARNKIFMSYIIEILNAESSHTSVSIDKGNLGCSGATTQQTFQQDGPVIMLVQNQSNPITSGFNPQPHEQRCEFYYNDFD